MNYPARVSLGHFSTPIDRLIAAEFEQIEPEDR